MTGHFPRRLLRDDCLGPLRVQSVVLTVGRSLPSSISRHFRSPSGSNNSRWFSPPRLRKHTDQKGPNLRRTPPANQNRTLKAFLPQSAKIKLHSWNGSRGPLVRLRNGFVWQAASRRARQREDERA